MHRIGIYSGTFDPVHDGHIAFAREASRICSLDKVIFLPEAVPRNKINVTDIATRFVQLQENLSKLPNLEVLDLEQSNFTIKQTLPELQRLFAGAELTLLIGSDVARSLDRWPDIDRLLETVSLAVGMRGDDAQDELKDMMRKLSFGDVTYVFTDYPHLSSSQLRVN